MKWGSPEFLPWLWLLLPVAWLLVWSLKRRERRLARLVDPSVLALLSPYRSARRARIRAWCWFLSLALLLLALAQPRWGFQWEEVRRRGLDVMVVLDTSRSMLAEDVKPNRLQQAKWGISDLVAQLRGDRVGLISFAGGNFLQCPLTIDYAAFRMMLDDVYVGIIPRGGTAMAPALEQAIKSFEQTRDADRSIILVTDGEDHEGDSLELLDTLKKEQIRVFAVGVGTLEGDLIPDAEQPQAGYFKNREGNVVKSTLQESALERLARETGGIYVRSAPGDFGLDRIFREGLDLLTRDEKESKMVKSYEERFAWPLGFALLLLAMESVLGTARRNRPTGEEA